jgi:TonB family protein
MAAKQPLARPGGYLARIVRNLALDRLWRSRRENEAFLPDGEAACHRRLRSAQPGGGPQRFGQSLWRQQGVPYVRIVMDREGKVLSSRLERSCGFPDLDREAVALPKRASPLPSPPDDKPGHTLELVVPVEFLLRTP